MSDYSKQLLLICNTLNAIKYCKDIPFMTMCHIQDAEMSLHLAVEVLNNNEEETEAT